MMYNYLEAMKQDIKCYLEENEISIDLSNRKEVEQELNDSLFISDEVTGNGSGSYTMNRLEARDYVIDNMNLVKEMCEEFSVESKTISEKLLSEDWEWFDVSIRCYLLNQAINETLNEITRA